ncbi:helix-turn-helix transcriptional regulator [Streptomyces sp. NPDC048270]|uniref:helix-turn-helix domain-containing protein n=1 Tax=Streptomyces sp. NPDC048270 TaxID=3154615 RepID=UPI00340FA751
MRTERRRGVSNFDGRRLAQARTRKGWTPSRLASEVNVTVTVLNQYELEERSPELGTLARLAEALGCPVEYLRRPARATLRDLRERAGAGQVGAAAATGLKRSTYAMLEQGRTKTLTPQVAHALAGLFDEDVDTVIAAHAEAVAGQLARPTPLVLEGRLLERLATHFAIAPEELLDLAQRLAGDGVGEVA